MKFLTDEMHGKLTKWLRLLGYDTKYAKDYEQKYGSPVNDNDLLEECFLDFRILITRDREFHNKMEKKFKILVMKDPKKYKKFQIINTSNVINELISPSLLLDSEELIENLAKISDKFGIRLHYNSKIARCSRCNARIIEILKEDIDKEEIPEQVYNYHENFWKCSNEKCNKYYWIGSHFERIIEQLQKIQDKQNKS